MLLHRKIVTIALGLLILFSSHNVLAQATSNPCPSSASQYGCFEVGLPGSKTFAANQPIGAFLDTKTPIKNLINIILTFALAILVIIGVITIVIGGYMYMTAAGNASQVQSAKEMIMSALLGIFIAFISVVLLNTINPFLGSKAVEPSLGPVGSGATSGGNSGNNSGLNTGFNGNEQQLLDLNNQRESLQGDINALDDPFASDAQKAINDAKIKTIQAQISDIDKQIAALNAQK